MTDWPQYESHKIVRAARIVNQERDTDGNVIAVEVDVPGFGKEWFRATLPEMTARAEIGDWAMRYPDGFGSISPAKAFEEGYTLLAAPPDAPAQLRADITTMVGVTSDQADEIVRLRAALQNCVDYWPAALNDDLQERTYREARSILEERPDSVRVTEASGNAKKRLVTHKAVIGELARWAIQQHPYGRPEGLFELGAKIAEAAQSWEIGQPSLKMREFESWQDFERWLDGILLGDPIMVAWNTPKSGHAQSIVASSRYWTPKPEYDFIDLDALIRNVARSVWATSAQE